MSAGVHQVPHWLVLNRAPLDRPTHKPPLQLSDWSNFITSVRPSPLKSPVSTLMLAGVTQVSHWAPLNQFPVDKPTQRPPLLVSDRSIFITSVRPSPLKSPAKTLMSAGVHQVPHWLVLNRAPLDRPTHKPPLLLFDWSTFITSVRPSPLKSPVSTLMLAGVHQVSQRLKLNWAPSDSPTHSPPLQ